MSSDLGSMGWYLEISALPQSNFNSTQPKSSGFRVDLKEELQVRRPLALVPNRCGVILLLRISKRWPHMLEVRVKDGMSEPQVFSGAKWRGVRSCIYLSLVTHVPHRDISSSSHQGR